MQGNMFMRSRRVALLMGLALAAIPMLAFAQSSSDTGGMVALLINCVCWLIGLGIDIALTYWVYNDAKKRGNPNAVLWAVLTFFFTLIGLILYVIIGRNQGTMMGGPPPAAPGGPSGPSNTVRY